VLIPWQQENILVDEQGHARLTHYGLSPIYYELDSFAIAIPDSFRMARWLAPEFLDLSPLDTDAADESKAADVFAFGMVAMEILTGTVLLPKTNDTMVATLIFWGERPTMPENREDVGLTDSMWKLFESCWHENPGERPTMRAVMGRLPKLVETSMLLKHLAEMVRHMIHL
jgi:hypothetical protein